MKIHNRGLLSEAQTEFSEAASQLKSWKTIVEDAEWNSSHDLRAQFPRAKIIGGRNVVFKILRNRYRLWVKVDYQHSIVIVKGFGTHKEYDKWEIK